MAVKNEGPNTYTGSDKPSKPKLYDWGDGRKVHTKPKPKKAAAPKADAGGYDWGDGHAVHSIPVEEHNANKGGVATYGVTPNTPLDAPLTAAQGYAMAQAAANRTYAPQLQANAQLQTNTPAWYQNYINRTGEQQKEAQKYAQPILDTAQTAVTNAGATAPGLDPSSPQYAKEQQAAAGRTTMAQDSANYLAGVAAATNAYFGGQANIAARDLPQAQAGLVYQAGQLGSQRQDAATAAYGDIRTNEQNASLARQTLGLNTANTAFDNSISRGVDPVTGEPLPTKAPTGYGAGAPGQNKYGYTYDEWNKLSPKAQAKARAGKTTGGKTQAQKDAETKAAAKKATDIKTSTGKVKVDVQNTIDKWNSYVGQQTDDTSKPKLPDGSYPARNLTPADIKRILGQKTDAGMIHVALLVKVGKPLDKAAIDYLHSKDPNIRIPTEWLKGKKKTATHPGTTKAPDGHGQMRPT